MKVAIVGSRGIHSTHGGIEKCLYELCPRLAGLGCTVDVFGATGSRADFSTPGVRSVKVPALRGKYSETLSRTLLATLMILAQPRRYDVVNFVAVGPGLLSFLPRLFGIPVVVSIHGLDWRRAKWPGFARYALRFAEYCLARMATDVTVVSRQLQGYFKERYGRDAAYTPNGLISPASADLSPLLGAFGIQPGRYILFASRLVKEKGAHELIAAFNKVDTDMHLVIAGSSIYDQDYVDALREMDRTGRCVFTGHLTGDVLAAVFQGAYLYVLPSHIEGMSLSLLEALSYGKPVLVSDIAENVEVVEDRAFTFPVGNVDALAERLAGLTQDPRLVEAMAERSANHIAHVLDWDATALRYHEVFAGAARRTSSLPKTVDAASVDATAVTSP